MFELEVILVERI